MINRVSLKPLFVGILLSFSASLFSQDDCKVLRKDISGTYKGKCKKGLADGYGFSQGKNKYKGEFKKGFPNGKGVLTYSDGGEYKGSFKKGLRNGNGLYSIKIKGKDSILDGKWSKGNFLKNVKKKMYKVLTRRSVSMYRIQKMNDSQNRITVKIMKDGNLYKSPQNITGSSGIQFYRFNTVGFEEVTSYPFICNMSYDVPSKLNGTISVEFQFEILGPGDWEVTLKH